MLSNMSLTQLPDQDHLNPTQQKLGWSILYHLFPGGCILLFYWIISPWLLKQGFPSSFAVLVGFLLVGIPLQVFILFREGYSVNGKISLTHIIFYTKKIPIWKHGLFILIFIVYAIIITSILSPINSYLLENCFSWLPEWFRNNTELLKPNSSPIIITYYVALFVIDGLLNPIIEEIYFRGFLMPRISRFGLLSPMISAALFSLAHYWQPWNILQIFILVWPIYFLVLKNKSIYISIVLHCTANLIGAFLSLAQYLSTGQH